MNVSARDIRYLGQMMVPQESEARVVRFPMLGRLVSANVEPVSKRNLPFAPWIVRDVAAKRFGARPLRVGVTGVSRQPSVGETIDGYRVTDPAAALRQQVPELRKRADVVVVLAYVRADEARALAKAVPGIDVMICAQDFLPGTVDNEWVETTLIAPVIVQTRWLTDVRVSQPSPGVRRFDARRVLLDRVVPDDPETLKMVFGARNDFIR